MVLDRRKTYEIAQALLRARNKRGEVDVLGARGVPGFDQLAFKVAPSTLSQLANPQNSYGRPLEVNAAYGTRHSPTAGPPQGRAFDLNAYPATIAERARAVDLATQERGSYRIPVQNSPANDNKLPMNWHCTTASHDCLSAAPTGAHAALCRDAYRACVNSHVEAQKRGIPQMSGFPDGGMVILFSNGDSRYIPSPYPAWPANDR